VQASRTRFREHIGTLVFDLVVPFADVERSEVVPGHADEVAGAVNVRAAVADLRRILEARAAKLREASAEDVQWHAQHLEQEMDAFGRTAPYRSLRAQDKRRLIEYRHEVREMAAQPLPAKADVMEVCQRVLELVKGLAVVNQRSLLVQHDHEVWARSGVKLEQAEALLAIDRRAAAVALAEAAELAAGLYGRSDGLDEFLRRARKRSLALVPAEEWDRWSRSSARCWPAFRSPSEAAPGVGCARPDVRAPTAARGRPLQGGGRLHRRGRHPHHRRPAPRLHPRRAGAARPRGGPGGPGDGAPGGVRGGLGPDASGRGGHRRERRTLVRLDARGALRKAYARPASVRARERRRLSR
jgi:hypothetical protein